MSSNGYERIALESAEQAGLGVLVAQLVPPRIVHANGAAAAYMGVTVEEVLTRAPFDFLAPEQRELAMARLRRRVAGEPLPAAELTVARPDGSRIVVECRFVNREVDGGPGAVVFFTAPNEPRSADFAADARYRQLVDAAPDGVAITREGRFLYANQAALALLGWSADELPSVSLRDVLSPEDLAVMIERTTAMLRTGQRFPPRDYPIRTPAGEHVVEVSSMVIDFEGGPAVLAFVRDVTETRRARADLERTQRLAALGTLIAGVAHEVNNPLAFAAMGAEQLERFFAGGSHDLEAGRAALSSVQSGLERITALVRELREFARSDPSELVPVDLAEVVASALRMTGPSVRNRVSIDVRLDALPRVRGRFSRLEQVFVNLFVNAAQSYASDDVTSNLVEVRAVRDGDEVKVTVSDKGSGIPPEHLGRVFDPFFTTKAGESIGLGLSIVHAIVEQHGGRVDIDSVIGQGTAVAIALRADHNRGADPENTAQSEATRPRRARTLVVDDEPAIGRMLRSMLGPECDVTVATDGQAALALLLAPDANYDVVLCDIKMPEISGVAIFEHIRVHRPDLARSFAFMTGGFFGHDVLERAADVPRLEKPFTAPELARVLERVRRARES